jgi:cytoskeleton protein RodZ
MTEPLLTVESTPTAPLPAEPASAGALLRAARQQQGVHIAALAAAMKVPQARLEALEAGRYHELVDTTFTRALAQAMCRSLRIDPKPVLALLPGSPPDALGRVDGGLNTPFREHGSRGLPSDWAPWRRPVGWLVALLLLAAAAFVLVPAGALRDPIAVGAGAPPALQVMPPDPAGSGTAGLSILPAAAVLPAASPSVAAPGQAASEPVPPLASASSGPAAVPVAGLVLVRARQDTWIQAVDANNQTLLARLVPAGEAVALNPQLPLRLRVGNVAGTEVLLRGKPVDLAAGNRDNIANLTLQ